MTNWVVLTEKGRVWKAMPKEPNYYKILDYAFNEFCSAGSTWDRPNQLFRDGVLIHSNLHAIAYNYGDALRKALSAASNKVREQFKEPE